MDIISLIKAFGYAGVWSALFIEGAFIFGIFLRGIAFIPRWHSNWSRCL